MGLTVGVWVLTVATVGAGVVEVGVEGVGWVSTPTLYLLLAIMVLLLLSGTFVLGPGDFLTMGLVLGWAGHGWFCCRQVCCGHVCCSWVWGWGLHLGPGLGTKFPFQFQVCFHLPDEGGVRTELCAPGITLDQLGCPVPSKHVNTLHCLHFNFHVYCLHR